MKKDMSTNCTLCACSRSIWILQPFSFFLGNQLSQPYTTMGRLRCSLSFSFLCSSIQAIRSAHFSIQPPSWTYNQYITILSIFPMPPSRTSLVGWMRHVSLQCRWSYNHKADKHTIWKKPHAFSVNVNHINTHSTKPDKKASYVLHNYW